MIMTTIPQTMLVLAVLAQIPIFVQQSGKAQFRRVVW